MSAEDLDVAARFLAALGAAARTGDRAELYALLASGAEWVMPQVALTGVDEAADPLTWIRPRERLDLEFGDLELTDLGGSRVRCDVREIYRMRDTGDFAYTRTRRIELTIRDRKVARYETRIVASDPSRKAMT